jgi:hypothetical protein
MVRVPTEVGPALLKTDSNQKNIDMLLLTLSTPIRRHFP